MIVVFKGIDLSLELGDAVVVFVDFVLEAVVFEDELFFVVFHFLDAVIEFCVFLFDAFVDVDVFLHVEELQFFHDLFFLSLVPSDLSFHLILFLLRFCH